MPKALAELTYHDKNDKAQLSLAGVRYATIADSLVKLTDDDFKVFYNENKKSLEREATRDIEYIIFDIVASPEDNRQAQTTVQSLANEFRTTTNVAGFVNANSETRYDSTWLTRDAVPASIESVVFDQEPGFVYGPYFEEGSFKLTRVVEIGMRSDSLKASHILIAYAGAMRSEQKRTKEQAKSMADSLLVEVKKRPAKMLEFAAALSDDASAKTNNGDLGWFKDGQMVPSFNQFALDNKVGTVGLVETDFGYHIIEVTGKKEPIKNIRLATITYEVAPSTKTYQDIFAKASKFATENKTAAQFNKAVETEGLNKRVAPALREMSNRIAGIENPRQVVRWAFDENTSVGDVSTIFDLDNMFVVALLTKQTDKGIPELADIKETIQPQVLNKKKGEYVLEKMKSAGEDLNRIATDLKTQVETTELAFDSRMLLNFGQESKVIGKIFSLQNGGFATIAGSTAAFAVKVNNFSISALPSQLDQIVNEGRTGFESTVRNNAPFKALEKVVKIEDNRKLFY
jgi:parvulin-like peptidyl-prolyl isomerase